MELLIAIAALAGVVWGGWFLLRGSLIAGCLLFLLATCCFGWPFLQFDAGPLPLTLDRLAIVLLAGMYIVQRGLLRTEPKPALLADKLLLLLLGLLTLSMFTHNWRSLPPGVVPPLWHLMTGYFMPAIVYWVARQAPLGRRSVGWVHGALAVFGVYLAATGLAEIGHQWWAVFPSYIADPTVGLHYGRARGPMVQAVSYGLFLGVTLLAVIVWRKRLSTAGRWLWLPVIPLQLAALYFTYTRSIWIGTTLAIVVMLTMLAPKVWRPAILATVLLLAGAVLANLDSLANLQREGNATEARESATMRECFAYVSWQMFLDRPLWGCGFGQFYTEKLTYLSDRSTPLQLELIRDYIHHNTYLSLLTETGVIGLGLFLTILGLWIRAGWRLCRDENPPWVRLHGVLLLGAVTTYAVQMMFHEVSYTSIDNSLIFLLAGVANGLCAQERPLAALACDALSTNERVASERG